MRGEVVVITGRLPWPRKEVKARLVQHGARVAGSVSNKTTVLIVGEDPGKKLEEARQLGIRIVRANEIESWFEQDQRSQAGPASETGWRTIGEVSTNGGPVLAIDASAEDDWHDDRDYEQICQRLHWQLMAGVETAAGQWAVGFRDPHIEIVHTGADIVLVASNRGELRELLDEHKNDAWSPTPFALSLPTGRLVVRDGALGGRDDLRVCLELEPGTWVLDRCRICAWNEREVVAARLRRIGPGDVTSRTDASRRQSHANRNALADELHTLDLPSYWPHLLTPRDAVVLTPRKKRRDDDLGRVGGSRLGGACDLPSSDDWPREPGMIFGMLLQLDLAQLAAFDTGGLLPGAGTLSFWLGIPDVIGLHTEWRTEGRVLYQPPDAELQAFVPGKLAPHARDSRSYAVDLRFVTLPPPPASQFLEGTWSGAYSDWYDRHFAEHHLESTINGFDRVFEDELAPDETMLLRLAGHEYIPYDFCETLTLNYAIKTSDLLARRFDRVRFWEGGSI